MPRISLLLRMSWKHSCRNSTSCTRSACLHTASFSLAMGTPGDEGVGAALGARKLCATSTAPPCTCIMEEEGTEREIGGRRSVSMAGCPPWLTPPPAGCQSVSECDADGRTCGTTLPCSSCIMVFLLILSLGLAISSRMTRQRWRTSSRAHSMGDCTVTERRLTGCRDVQ